MPFDCFLFDLDGTLVDSLADLAGALNRLRAELDLEPLPLAAVRANIGDGASLLVRRSLPPNTYSDSQLQRFLHLYREQLLQQTVLYPGIAAFLQAHRHDALAVVTNKPLQLSHALLQGLGLTDLFPVVIGGDSCAEKKPAAAPLLLALARLGRPATTALMLGDHHTDLRAGRAAGVRTCFCGWGLGHTDGLRSDYTAATPADLLRLFPGRPA